MLRERWSTLVPPASDRWSRETSQREQPVRISASVMPWTRPAIWTDPQIQKTPTLFYATAPLYFARE